MLNGYKIKGKKSFRIDLDTLENTEHMIKMTQDEDKR